MKEAGKRDLDIKKALSHADLKDIQENNLPLRVPLKKFISLVDYFTEKSDDPSFYFLSFFNTIAPEKYDVSAMIVLNMPNLYSGEKFGVMMTNKIFNFLNFNISIAEKQITNTLYSFAPGDRAIQLASEMLFINGTQIINLYTSGRGKALRVEFPYGPVSYKNKLEDFFQCPVLFNKPHAAVYFEADPRSVNPAAPSQNTLKYLFQRGNAEWNRYCRSGMTGRVRNEIFKNLRKKTPTLEEAAENLGVHPRVLQKELQYENTTFREILGHIRLNRAIPLIFKTNMPCEEIAKRTGFENPEAFASFVRRISGKSFAELRKQRDQAGVMHF